VLSDHANADAALLDLELGQVVAGRQLDHLLGGHGLPNDGGAAARPLGARQFR
jgi:hypothetical protein